VFRSNGTPSSVFLRIREPRLFASDHSGLSTSRTETAVRKRPHRRGFRSAVVDLQTEKDSMAEQSGFELPVPHCEHPDDSGSPAQNARLARVLPRFLTFPAWRRNVRAKLRLSMSLVPLVYAMFANSPLCDGRLSSSLYSKISVVALSVVHRRVGKCPQGFLRRSRPVRASAAPAQPWHRVPQK
jgi:hypothetical protein